MSDVRVTKHAEAGQVTRRPTIVVDVRSATPSISIVLSLTMHAEEGDTDGMRHVFATLFEGISARDTESSRYLFKAVLTLALALLGISLEVKTHTDTGRVDAAIRTERFVYETGFTVGGTTDEVIKGIRRYDLSLPRSAGTRERIEIGCTFDSKTGLMSGWEVRAAR